MSRPFRTATLIGLVAIVLLSACSAPGPEPAAATDPFDLVAPIEPTWTAEVDLIGYPIYLDGFVASYVAAPDGALHVVVWDAATGSEVWRNIAGLGATTYGSITLAGLEVGGKSFVTYLSPSSNPDDADGWSDLMITEIGTATSTIGMDSEVWAHTLPTVCDDKTTVCFRGFLKDTVGEDSADFRSEPGSGIIVAGTTATLPANSGMIGTNLFYTNDPSPGAVEQLGYSADGIIVWQVPYADVFGDGYSSDGGWNWNIFASDDVIVGKGILHDPNRTYGDEYVADSTRHTTVGVDPANGEVLWRIAGAGPCAGDTTDYQFVDGLIPLCRFNAGTETATFGPDGTTLEFARADYDLDLLGVDPLSGEIVWTVTLSDAGFNAPTTDLSFRSFSPTRPFSISGTVRLVDTLRGEATDVPEGAILPCNESRDPFQATNLVSEPESTSDYGAGNDAVPCTSDLVAIDGTAYSAGAARMAGVETAANTFVIGGASGLSSYTLPD